MTTTPKPRGFAAWSPEKLAEVSSRGGKAKSDTKGLGSMSDERRKAISAMGVAARKKPLTPQQ